MRTGLVCGSLLAAMAVFAAFPLIALDLPLHIAMGELILDRGAVPPTNVVLHTEENTPCTMKLEFLRRAGRNPKVLRTRQLHSP